MPITLKELGELQKNGVLDRLYQSGFIAPKTYMVLEIVKTYMHLTAASRAKLHRGVPVPRKVSGQAVHQIASTTGLHPRSIYRYLEQMNALKRREK